MVDDDGGGRRSKVYIGRTGSAGGGGVNSPIPPLEIDDGNDGGSLGNPWELVQGACVAARAEVCKRCDALNDDSMHDPMPRTVQPHMCGGKTVGRATRQGRAARDGSDAAVGAHGSGRVAAAAVPLSASRAGDVRCDQRCHGDGIAMAEARRATARRAGKPGHCRLFLIENARTKP